MGLDDITRDVRHAWRTLANNPNVSAIVVLTLAVGIAANTAVFSVADALLLRPLPYQDADRLVALRSISGAAETPGGGTSSARDLADWQTQATSFDAIAGYRWRSVDLRGDLSSQRLHGLYVTPEYFAVVGITQVNGRTFSPSDRGTNVIILGRRVWTERFAASPALIGSTLDVSMINLGRSGATPSVVLGAALVDAHFPPVTADFNLGKGNEDDTIDFWLPEFPPAQTRGNRGLDVVAKLRPGITVARAQSEMDAIATHLAEAFPDTNKGWGIRVVPLRMHVAGAPSRVVLLLSLGTGLVLLIACGNVSTLLLVRGLSREREVAVRVALGASRPRIVRQFLVESLLISIAAAVLGVGGASIGIHLLIPWFPSSVPLIHDASINAAVVGFVIATAAITTCLTGLMPAWIFSARGSGSVSLNGRGQSAGRWQHRAISGLTAAQVALTIVLLVSTGLLLRSAERLWRVDPGFSPNNVLTMTISLPNNKFEWQHNVTFERDVVTAVKTLADVRAAAAIQGVPMRAGGFWTGFSVEGMPPVAPADLPVAHMQVVSSGYFGVMQIPVLDGRDFDDRDDVGERGHPQFVIVNRTLAARFWPGERAAGKRLRQEFNPNEWVTVAGVVGDVNYSGMARRPRWRFTCRMGSSQKPP
jgi:putative ABC transport system permease protein